MTCGVLQGKRLLRSSDPVIKYRWIWWSDGLLQYRNQCPRCVCGVCGVCVCVGGGVCVCGVWGVCVRWPLLRLFCTQTVHLGPGLISQLSFLQRWPLRGFHSLIIYPPFQEVRIPGKKSFGFSYETRVFVSTVDREAQAAGTISHGDEIVQVNMCVVWGESPPCMWSTVPSYQGWLSYVIDIAWDRVFYEIYRHEHEGELPCILHKTRWFLMLCFISRRSLITYRVIIKI